MTAYLALDTATDFGSVAVGTPGSVISEVSVADKRHATTLIPAVQEALRLADLEYRDLTGIVLADGPGSFTGLRIAFATAKGIICEHDGLSLSVTPSLMALAWSVRNFADGPVASLFDALRGEVFGAVYSFPRSGVVAELEPRLGTVTQLAEACSANPRLAVGCGAIAYRAAVREWTGREPVGPPDAVPRASHLLDLLAVSGATISVHDPGTVEPNYGRKAEAQVRWEQAEGRELNL